MEKIFVSNQIFMMQGLESRIKNMGQPEFAQKPSRMQQVYDAFKPYAEGKQLPPGTTPQIMRFLVVSAGVPGLWGKLDALDSRLGDALISCYGEGKTLATLTEQLGIANISYMLRRGLTKLHKWMPEQSEEFALDKNVEFPLKYLIGTLGERQRVAGRKAAEGKNTSEWGRRTAAIRWWTSVDQEEK